jgi:hypothetical protein
MLGMPLPPTRASSPARRPGRVVGHGLRNAASRAGGAASASDDRAWLRRRRRIPFTRSDFPRFLATTNTLGERLADRPGEAFPKALSDSELEAANRFFGNENVTPDAILAPYFRQTVRRATGLPRVIVVHDTTAFDPSLTAAGHFWAYGGNQAEGCRRVAVCADSKCIGTRPLDYADVYMLVS